MVQSGRRPAYVLGRYPQWTRTFFGTADGLPSSDVTHLAVTTSGDLWAATPAGLARWTGDGWRAERQNGAPAGPFTLLYGDRRGRLWASADGALYRLENGAWTREAGFDLAVRAMAEDEAGTLWAITDQALVRHAGSTWRYVTRAPRANVRDLAAFGEGRVFAATDKGLHALDGKRPHWFAVRKGPTGIPTDDLRCVIADRWGHLWLGTDIGVVLHDDGAEWRLINGKKGLPYEDVRLIVRGPDGERWIGTSKGLVRWSGGTWKYFGYKRWLPHHAVQAIAIDKEGNVWVGTPEGISRLSEKLMTLAEKAAYYDKMVQEYHTRLGYVTVSLLEREGDLASGRVEISDNDGMWTGLYIAAQSYRYAATGDEKARALAKRSMDALMFLSQVTGIPGFAARSVRHRSEPEFGTPHPEFHRTPDGEWEWKCETSSDEMVGHFYAYSVYYDLAADEEHKVKVRETVRAIMDHILDHGYYLVDRDGKRTTWAVWAPEKLNGDAKWWAERGCNSLEILSFLKVAAHITGDEKYEKAYRELVTQHHYALNAFEHKITEPEGGRVNHIDDNLAFLCYRALLTYETDPDLRAMYLAAIEHHWQHERLERSPIWNAIYGALTGRPWDAEAAVQSLAELPLDLIHWRVENSHRADVKIDPELAELGIVQAAVPLPYDERPMHKWDANPYRLDGGDGKRAEDGTVFLHPYWLARYYGLIVEPDEADRTGAAGAGGAQVNGTEASGPGTLGTPSSGTGSRDAEAVEAKVGTATQQASVQAAAEGDA